jgi:hypothetical protein
MGRTRTTSTFISMEGRFMVSRTRAALASALALGTAAALVAAPSTSAAPRAEQRAAISTVASGLDLPFGLQSAREHRGLLVAEYAGKVTRVFMDGRKRTILGDVPGVSGVAGGPRRVFALIGGPNEEGAPSGGKYGPSRIIRMTYNGKGKEVIANLLRYELKHNPDGQKQFNSEGEPYDATSNPFAITWSKFGLFVAEGGANAVLRVNPRTGRITTFFVPPTITTESSCRGDDVQANPGTRGCDSVPTGVQVVGNSLYVSTLGSERKGAGRIYKLDARTGKVQNKWTNLTGPTGVAVRRDGTLYFSQVLHQNAGGPPGRIVRIKDGRRTFAPVPMPVGLLLREGKLYSTQMSLAGPGAGSIVRVPDSAFQGR